MPIAITVGEAAAVTTTGVTVTTVTLESLAIAAAIMVGISQEQAQIDYNAGIIWVSEAIAVPADQVHADTRHGKSAQDVRDCLAKNGPVKQMFNPGTNRTGNICAFDDGGFGVRVCSNDDGCEVTSFPKEKMGRIEQVIKYLKNVGYKEL